ncbi:MAG: hypothetical protein HZB67_01940 [Candidatus Aenigmarchaeota archaeon]|nr:hypothetical protein [Candidatus Aenigmarchaeota archaeon]
MLGVIIFLVVLVMIIPLWFYVDLQIRTSEESKEMEDRLVRTSDVLIKSPGSPENWNATNVLSIGFSSGDRQLNTTKIISFLDMNYQDSKKKLGIEGYEFYLYFNHLNGSLVTFGGKNFSYGMNYTQAAGEIHKIERIVILKDTGAALSVMNLVLWR